MLRKAAGVILQYLESLWYRCCVKKVSRESEFSKISRFTEMQITFKFIVCVENMNTNSSVMEMNNPKKLLN